MEIALARMLAGKIDAIVTVGSVVRARAEGRNNDASRSLLQAAEQYGDALPSVSATLARQRTDAIEELRKTRRLSAFEQQYAPSLVEKRKVIRAKGPELFTGVRSLAERFPGKGFKEFTQSYPLGPDIDGKAMYVGRIDVPGLPDVCITKEVKEGIEREKGSGQLVLLRQDITGIEFSEQDAAVYIRRYSTNILTTDDVGFATPSGEIRTLSGKRVFDAANDPADPGAQMLRTAAEQYKRTDERTDILEQLRAKGPELFTGVRSLAERFPGKGFKEFTQSYPLGPDIDGKAMYVGRIDVPGLPDVCITKEVKEGIEREKGSGQLVLLRQDITGIEFSEQDAAVYIRRYSTNILTTDDVGFATPSGEIRTLAGKSVAMAQLSLSARKSIDTQLSANRAFGLDEPAGEQANPRTGRQIRILFPNMDRPDRKGCEVELDDDAIAILAAPPPPGLRLVLRPRDRAANNGERAVLRKEDFAYARIDDRQQLEVSPVVRENGAVCADAKQASHEPVAVLEKKKEEGSRDIMRSLDRDKDVQRVTQLALSMQGPLQEIQAMLQAGQQGFRTQAFINLTQGKMSDIHRQLHSAALRGSLRAVKDRIAVLKGIDTGIAMDRFDREIEGRIRALEDFAEKLEDPRTDQVFETVMKCASFTKASEWYDFFRWENIMPMLATITAMIVVTGLVIATGGLALAMVAGAAAALIAGELGKEGVRLGYKIAGSDLIYERSRLGQYLSEGKMRLPSGEMVEMSFVRDVAEPYLQEFAIGAAMNLGLMGVGGLAAKFIAPLCKAKIKSTTAQLILKHLRGTAELAERSRVGFKEFVTQMCTRKFGKELAWGMAKGVADMGIQQKLDSLAELHGLLGHCYFAFTSFSHGFKGGVQAKAAARIRGMRMEAVGENGSRLRIGFEGNRADMQAAVREHAHREGWEVTQSSENGEMRLWSPDRKYSTDIVLEGQAAKPSPPEKTGTLSERVEKQGTAEEVETSKPIDQRRVAPAISDKNMKKISETMTTTPEFIHQEHPEIGKIMDYISALERQPAKNDSVLSHPADFAGEARAIIETRAIDPWVRRGNHPSIDSVILHREDLASQLRTMKQHLERAGAEDTPEYAQVKEAYNHNQDRLGELRMYQQLAEYVRDGAHFIEAISQKDFNQLYPQGDRGVNPHREDIPVFHFRAPDLPPPGINAFHQARAYGISDNPIVSGPRGSYFLSAGRAASCNTYTSRAFTDAHATPFNADPSRTNAAGHNPADRFKRVTLAGIPEKNLPGRDLYLSAIAPTKGEKGIVRVGPNKELIYSDKGEAPAGRLQTVTPAEAFTLDPKGEPLMRTDWVDGKEVQNPVMINGEQARGFVRNQGRIGDGYTLRYVEATKDLPASLGEQYRRSAVDAQKLIADRISTPLFGSLPESDHQQRWHEVAKEVLKRERSALAAAQRVGDLDAKRVVETNFKILRDELTSERLLPPGVRGTTLTLEQMVSATDTGAIVHNVNSLKEGLNTFRDQRRRMVSDRMQELPVNDPERYALAERLLRDEGLVSPEQPLYGRDPTHPLQLQPGGAHAEAIRRAHDDIGTPEQKAGLERFTLEQLRQKRTILLESGFTDEQATALMRAGIAGLEAAAQPRQIAAPYRLRNVRPDLLQQSREYTIKRSSGDMERWRYGGFSNRGNDGRVRYQFENTRGDRRDFLLNQIFAPNIDVRDLTPGQHYRIERSSGEIEKDWEYVRPSSIREYHLFKNGSEEREFHISRIFPLKPGMESGRMFKGEPASADIVLHNFNQMNTSMRGVSLSESIGGNAGFATIDGKQVPCFACNGYADPKTGKILAFGNYQDVDPIIRNKGSGFTLRITVAHPMRIINFYHDSSFSEQAQSAIEQAIQKWHAKQEDNSRMDK